jgi:hypothetical protein
MQLLCEKTLLPSNIDILMVRVFDNIYRPYHTVGELVRDIANIIAVFFDKTVC